MKTSWRTEFPQWLIVAAMFLGAAWSWTNAPDRIPVHWNVFGEVDRYGGKIEGLLLLPLFAIGLYVLLLVAPRFDPGRANYARFSGTYTAIRVGVLALMAVIYGVTLLTVHGRPIDVATAVPLAVGALFVLLGSVMHRLKPNWFVGIRTPWTLSSQRSWAETHRVGGWLFVVMGAALIAMAFVRAEWAVVVMVMLMLGSVVWMYAYSWWVWRGDPDKAPPGGKVIPPDDA